MLWLSVENLKNCSPVKPEVKKSYPNWSMDEAAEDIYHLQDEGFEQFANEQNGMMVFFYSPSKH